MRNSGELNAEVTRPDPLKIVKVTAETMLFKVFHITNVRSHRVQVDIVNQT